jgi:hypothetical protein
MYLMGLRTFGLIERNRAMGTRGRQGEAPLRVAYLLSLV